MQTETAQAIVDAADEIGVEASLYEGYSGRGMYGERTAGVVVGSMVEFVAAVAEAAASLTHTAAEIAVDAEAGDRARDFIAEMRRLRTDSLGRDVIVY